MVVCSSNNGSVTYTFEQKASSLVNYAFRNVAIAVGTSYHSIMVLENPSVDFSIATIADFLILVSC